MVPAPIQFDCASGVLEGANLWVRMAVLAAGAKISSQFSRRGSTGYANLLRKTLPSRESPSSSPTTRLSKYPKSNSLQSVTELSILDRIKVQTGYNVTASAFRQNRIDALNADAARHMQ